MRRTTTWTGTSTRRTTSDQEGRGGARLHLELQLAARPCGKLLEGVLDWLADDAKVTVKWRGLGYEEASDELWRDVLAACPDALARTRRARRPVASRSPMPCGMGLRRK